MLVKDAPSGWVGNPALLHLVTRDARELVVTLTQQATASAAGLSEGSIYNFDFAGKCVKASTSAALHGIEAPVEIRCTFPLVYTVATEGAASKILQE